jgi:phytoene synthase
MMTYVMLPDDPEPAIGRARTLGEAFQLTNFLRDVHEDIVDRGRIYVPLETLRRHDATESQVEALAYDESFAEAIRDELARAESLYREGVAGIKYLPDDCQLPVLTAAVLYADHHRLIRELDCDVLSETPSLSAGRKLSLVARTWLHWRWQKDPEAVFAKVSAVPNGTTTRHGPDHGEPSVAR